MSSSYSRSLSLPKLGAWKKAENARLPLSFTLELTARCNNNCRHCYINLPAGDREARKKELSLSAVKKIADQAFSQGVLWCLLTGGEPMLRDDFSEIYLYLKKKGFLVSVFTNATLINPGHIRLFKKHTPRDIEVSVYGVTRDTYERVTRKPGSFSAFMRGLDLLLKNNIRVRFKAMALHSNVGELSQISSFCRKITKDYFRFDPLLNLRFDMDGQRNEEIKSERLSPEEIVAIERADDERLSALKNNCGNFINPELAHFGCDHIFHCGAGNNEFAVSYNGFFRLCQSLCHPACTYDLKKGTLKEAWQSFVPAVRDMRSKRDEFLKKCRVCPVVNLCLWCPAHSHLETGELDKSVEYFCKVAYARAESLQGIA